MPTRTYLTTPPGREPALDGSTDGVVERFVPGLDLPSEPTPNSRARTVATVTLAVVLAVLVLSFAFQVVTGAQAEDPSLSDSAGQGQQ